MHTDISSIKDDKDAEEFFRRHFPDVAAHGFKLMPDMKAVS